MITYEYLHYVYFLNFLSEDTSPVDQRQTGKHSMYILFIHLLEENIYKLH